MTRPRHSDCQRFVVRKPQLGLGDLHYAATHTEEPPPRWRPSIHMPRWASRITLEITGVRVERLQDITEEDAIAEGIYEDQVIVGAHCNGGTHTEVRGSRFFGTDDNEGFEFAAGAYKALWDSIYGRDSWDKNPWVWVVEFKRVES